MPKRIVFPLSPYPYTLIVSFAEKDKALIEYLRGENLIQEESDTEWLRMGNANPYAGKTLFNGDRMVVLIRFNFPLASNNPRALGTVAHEVYHAVTMVFDALPITWSFDSDEAFAYMIGHIVKTIYEHR